MQQPRRPRRLFTLQLVARMIGASLLVIVSLVGLGVCAVSGAFPSPTTDRPRAPDKFDACVIAQQYIEERLVAPSTAKHAPCDEGDIAQVGDNRWSVSSWVDSDNALGVPIRTRYRAELLYLGENKWRLESLDY